MEPDWQRVAECVRTRREELRLTQADAASLGGISEPSWNVLENNRQHSYKRRTLLAVCTALGWTSDSIERILDGHSPLLQADVESQLANAMVALDAPDLDHEQRLADLERRVAAIEAAQSPAPLRIAADSGTRRPSVLRSNHRPSPPDDGPDPTELNGE